MSSLDPRARVEQALGSVEPAQALFALAKQMRDEGMPQAELEELYMSFIAPLSSQADQTAYDGLLDTLDCIVGWCQQSHKFYPEGGPSKVQRCLIDRQTGTLVLPSGTVGRDLTRSAFMSSLMGAQSRCDDMQNGWMDLYPGAQTLDGLVFGVRVVFEGERLDYYSLWLADPRYGTSWDDWSEEKQLAQRDAHDAWLVTNLGPGRREPSPRGPELRYAFPWGEVWSTYDARGGSSTIGVRFRRDALLPV